MELEGNSNSGTSAAFLEQLRERHPGPLKVIWGWAIEGRSGPARFPAQFPASGKCTSHLGLGLGADWKALSRLLFVKGSSWEYEKQVRLLVDLQEARDTGNVDHNGWPVKVMDIPPEAIKEIYNGVHTPKEDLAQAIEIARGENKRGLFEGHVSSHAFRIQKTGGVNH